MIELLGLATVGGVNVGFLIGIIGLLAMVRKFDTKKVLSGGFYLIAVVVLGLLAGIVGAKGSIADILGSGLTHAGVASLLYNYWQKINPLDKKTKFEVVKKKE